VDNIACCNADISAHTMGDVAACAANVVACGKVVELGVHPVIV